MDDVSDSSESSVDPDQLVPGMLLLYLPPSEL